MSRGVARHYLMTPETWALEYARGTYRAIIKRDNVLTWTRMDSPYAAYGLCRYVHFNSRFPDYLAYDLVDRERHGIEPMARKGLAIDLDGGATYIHYTHYGQCMYLDPTLCWLLCIMISHVR